ncbi:response regulator [Faecalibacter bovis]|uniref:Response regulator transcription factor n=1 Tax=Faecalibacter bovis TaxID=2898187 RepID=A0ABX7XG05_9FLAO|nr:response regulator [Faecalibacter bovis]QTV06846.1 response regulator transcription factor [Faecalibacter bovis]
MIRKILIAEDIDSINTGIISILKDKYDFEIEHANSCDKALLKIKKATLENTPFDLLISDLSFKTDGLLDPELKNGEELVSAAKKIQSNLKTIIYTIEDKPALLKRLKDEVEVNSIVLKGLNSLIELCTSIEKLNTGENYFTTEVLHKIKNNSTTTIEEYDITILDLLSQGFTQQDISTTLKSKKIKPSSVSAIEKRIGELKTTLKANNSIHLVAIAKDMFLI